MIFILTTWNKKMTNDVKQYKLTGRELKVKDEYWMNMLSGFSIWKVGDTIVDFQEMVERFSSSYDYNVYLDFHYCNGDCYIDVIINRDDMHDKVETYPLRDLDSVDVGFVDVDVCYKVESNEDIDAAYNEFVNSVLALSGVDDDEWVI